MKSGMTWPVRIKQNALKELSRIAKTDRRRIVSAIDDLPAIPYRGSVLKGDLTGLRRIRVGSYRVVYEVRETELNVLVVALGHRGSVYR